MIFWSWFTLIGLVRGHSFLCSLLVYLGLHINVSKPDFCLIQTFLFWGLCLDTVHMSVSLPSDKLADIQQLALSFLQTQPVTVCQVISFLVKANFYANGHCQTTVIVSCHLESFNCYHSPTPLFSSVYFFFSALLQLEQLSHLQQTPVPLQFHFLMWLLLQMPHPLIESLFSGFWFAIIS